MGTLEVWNIIKQSLTETPIELFTRVKIRKEPLWFSVWIEKENIYVRSAKENAPSSKIKGKRTLGFEEFKRIYPLYVNREAGEKVSKDAGKATHNQVYWYSIIYYCTKTSYSIIKE